MASEAIHHLGLRVDGIELRAAGVPEVLELMNELGSIQAGIQLDKYTNRLLDVTGHRAEAWIEDLYDKGITSGFHDGTYRPENQVTRADMAVFLVNAFSLHVP